MVKRLKPWGEKLLGGRDGGDQCVDEARYEEERVEQYCNHLWLLLLLNSSSDMK